MDSAVQSIAKMSLDPTLKEIQTGSMATIQMLSKTFCAVLIAFQQQINESKENGHKISDIYSKLTNIDTQISDTNQSLHSAVTAIDTKLLKQQSETDTKLLKIESNVSEMTQNLESKCKAMMTDVATQLTESAKNVSNVSNELSKYAVSLQTMSNKVETTLDSVNAKQSEIESQITDTQQMITANLCQFKEIISENQKCVFAKVRNVSEKFQTLRFEVDQISAKKADIEDMKRKANKREMSELSATLSRITNLFQTNIEEINEKISTNSTKFERNISENKAILTQKLSVFEEEMSRMNNTLGELEYKLSLKTEERTDNSSTENILEMIHALQRSLESVMNSSNGSAKVIMGATSSGSCFSCGQRVINNSSFPALPIRHRSPDKKNIGGGFTFDPKNANKNNHKFNDKMRNELVQIASDLSSPKHRKFAERKPMKLPKLGKSNTTSQLL